MGTNPPIPCNFYTSAKLYEPQLLFTDILNGLLKTESPFNHRLKGNFYDDKSRK